MRCNIHAVGRKRLIRLESRVREWVWRREESRKIPGIESVIPIAGKETREG